MANGSLIDRIIAEFKKFIEPLNWIFSSAETLSDFLAGLDLDLPKQSIDITKIENFKTSILGDLGNLDIDAAKTQITGIQDFLSSIQSSLVTSINLVDLLKKILDFLVYTYLKTYHPILFQFFAFAGILDLSLNIGKILDRGQPIRPSYAIQWGNIPQIFLNPKKVLESIIWVQSDEQLFNINVLKDLKNLAIAIGIPASLTTLEQPILKNIDGNINEGNFPDFGLYRQLDIPLFRFADPATGITVAGFKIVPIPRIEGVPIPNMEVIWRGMAIVPYIIGNYNWLFQITNNLKLTIATSTGAKFAIKILPDQVEIVTPDVESARFSAKLDYTNNGSKSYIFGGPDHSRLEFENLAAELALKQVDNVWELALEVDLSSLNLVIQRSDGDGFIQKILPSSPLMLNFGIVIGLSNKRFYIKSGSASDVGLAYTFNINKSLGPVLIKSVDVQLAFQDPNLILTLATSGSVELGPLTLTIKEIGMKTTIEFNKPGILGNADLSFGFKPPTGIGLAIDAGVVKGGGFLDIDPPNYAGIFSLAIAEKFEVTAIGLLTTKLPNGKDGYSLLLSLTAKFEPGFQLGYGFVLNGIGGLIGFNRGMNKTALIEAQRSHSLDSVLFPEDPIKNATTIITTLESIFPPKEKYYVFGPMVSLFWGGAKKLVEFEVGIFIEFGGPGLIALVGLAHAELPDKKCPTLVLNADILGVLDLGNKSLDIQSSIFNSSLLQKFTLCGDLVLKSNWGDDPDFVLSMGGFHPRFTPPPGFPSMKRLQISLGEGNPRISLATYLAITTNTFQMGAKLDLWAKKAGFSATAALGFDALVKFNPFYFEVDMFGNAAIKRGSTNLLTAGLDVNLSGPNPYHVKGFAEFSVCGIGAKVDFDKTFGEKLVESPTINSPKEMLVNALEAARPIFTVPSWANEGVILAEGGKDLLSPLGTVTIMQNAVPIGLYMDKFGDGVPADGEHQLDIVVLEGLREVSPRPQTHFAPAQFIQMNDNEKLIAPSFDLYDAGIKLGGQGCNPSGGEVAKCEVTFENYLIDDVASSPQKLEKPFTLPSVANFIQIQESWALQSFKKVFRPIKKVRDQKLIQIRNARFTVTGYSAVGNRFERVLVGGMPCKDMTYYEARAIAKRLNSSSIQVRSSIYATLRGGE